MTQIPELTYEQALADGAPFERIRLVAQWNLAQREARRRAQGKALDRLADRLGVAR